MKFKNKGRKIYKTKEKNYYGKSPAGKILSGALSLLLLGGIGFLGYSAAEPIINYTRKKGDSDVSASDASDSSENSQAASETASAQETSGSAQIQNAEKFCAVSVTSDDLSDIGKLKAALMNIPDNEGIEYVFVPLKVSGGEIYYASSVYEAQMCGAVKSELTLDQITEAIRDEGFKPAAEISLLHDNLLPQTYPDSGYKTQSDGSRWIDNDAESGGKPWTSPFSEVTINYLDSIAGEVAASDFEKVVCCDAVFPNFRESDLEIIESDAAASDRYEALTSIVNMMYSRLTAGSSVMMLEVSAYDLICGNDDVIQPMLLDVNTIVLDIDFDELGDGITTDTTYYAFDGTSAENASKAIELTQEELSDYNVAVRFSGEEAENLSADDAEEIISGFGYTSYIIG